MHHLQREAEGVTSSDLPHLIRDFYLERLAVLLRHESAARFVSNYDINNAYQFVVSREETHISWLQHALVEQGLEIPPDPPTPAVTPTGKGTAVIGPLASDDARLTAEFVRKWTPRVEAITHARHRKMMQVMLGEMLEQGRIFDQASAGRTDLIGIPLAGTERRGVVLGTRWVE